MNKKEFEERLDKLDNLNYIRLEAGTQWCDVCFELAVYERGIIGGAQAMLAAGLTIEHIEKSFYSNMESVFDAMDDQVKDKCIHLKKFLANKENS